jgi:hypothetical protein
MPGFKALPPGAGLAVTVTVDVCAAANEPLPGEALSQLPPDAVDTAT